MSPLVVELLNDISNLLQKISGDYLGVTVLFVEKRAIIAFPLTNIYQGTEASYKLFYQQFHRNMRTF